MAARCSPDLSSLYVADTVARCVWRFALDAAGELAASAAPAVFCQLGAEEGVPDGLAVDADGTVWVRALRDSPVAH